MPRFAQALTAAASAQQARAAGWKSAQIRLWQRLDGADGGAAARAAAPVPPALARTRALQQRKPVPTMAAPSVQLQKTQTLPPRQQAPPQPAGAAATARPMPAGRAAALPPQPTPAQPRGGLRLQTVRSPQ